MLGPIYPAVGEGFATPSAITRVNTVLGRSLDSMCWGATRGFQGGTLSVIFLDS